MNKRKETIVEETFDEQGRVIKRVTTMTEEEEEDPAPITITQPYNPLGDIRYCCGHSDTTTTTILNTTSDTQDPNQITIAQYLEGKIT